MKKVLIIGGFVVIILISSLLIINNKPNKKLEEQPNEEKPNEILEKYEFNFDDYVLTESDRIYLDESYELYKSVVDSILKGEKIKEVENILDYQKIFNILNNRCPFFYLVKDMTYNEKDKTINIVYKNDTEKHLKLISDFKNMVKQIMEYNIKYGDSNTDIAMSLYKYTSTSINYDSIKYNSVYPALMNKKGNDINYALTYQYLLLQAGIESYIVHGTTLALQKHFWVMVKLGGNYYHMDPYLEKTETAGYGLYYFGMNDEKRLESVNNEFNKEVGEWEVRHLPQCSSEVFNDFRNKILWTNDRKNNRLELINNDTGTSYWNKID